jgi:hypothetical protein
MATVPKKKHAPYPWIRWFKKQRFVLERGRHFECQTHGMVAQIRSAAKKYLPRKARISIEVAEDVIAVTVIK